MPVLLLFVFYCNALNRIPYDRNIVLAGRRQFVFSQQFVQSSPRADPAIIYQGLARKNDIPMARFECSRCGKCCVSLGPFIAIERQLSDRDYYCRNSLTGEIFPVHLHADPGQSRERPDYDDAGARKGCIFMVKDREGPGFSCDIYENRPSSCREFRCYRMVIFNGQGLPCGKVVGRNGISTSDTVLEKLWTGQITSIPHAHPAAGNDPAWVKKVISILAAHGYRAEPAE